MYPRCLAQVSRVKNLFDTEVKENLDIQDNIAWFLGVVWSNIFYYLVIA